MLLCDLTFAALAVNFRSYRWSLERS